MCKDRQKGELVEKKTQEDVVRLGAQLEHSTGQAYHRDEQSVVETKLTGPGKMAAHSPPAISMAIPWILLYLSVILASFVACEGTFEELSFTVEPSDSVVAGGQAAILLCSAHHSRQEPSIQWMKDGDLLTFDKTDSHRILLQNGSLHIPSATRSRYRSDHGVYQCVASIEGLGSIVSKKATLTLGHLNTKFRSEPQDLAVHLGDTAVFRCSIKGQPRPSIKWRKDGDSVNTNRDSHLLHDDGTLEIRSVAFSDFASYSCQLQNVAGSKNKQKCISISEQ